jgi:hypothetical protein
VLGLTLVGVLALIGTASVWVLYKRKKCRCRLCRGDLKLGECIGSGGFGEVFIVTLTEKSWTEEISEMYGNFWREDQNKDNADKSDRRDKTNSEKK